MPVYTQNKDSKQTEQIGVALMPAESPVLPVCRLRIVMQSRWAAKIPPYPGMMLRGAMGHALKRVFCTVAHRDCGRCHLQAGCGYFQIFHTENQARKSQGYFFSPHPYVIRVGSVEERGEKTCIEWHLSIFGDAIREAPYLILAFEAMGKGGFGKGHTPFDLLSVYDELGGTELWNPQSQSIQMPKSQNLYALAHKLSQGLAQSAGNSTEALLRLQSPLRIEIKKKRIKQLNPKYFFDALLRRTRLVHACHGSGPLEMAGGDMPTKLEIDATKSALTQEAKGISTDPRPKTDKVLSAKLLQRVTWETLEEKEVRIPRYSNRQGRRLEMRGIIGSYRLSGLSFDLLFWLALGGMLHVGKSTAFGFGHYTLEL